MKLPTSFGSLDQEEQDQVLDQELATVGERPGLIGHRLASTERMNRLYRALAIRVARIRQQCPDSLAGEFDKLLGHLDQLNRTYPRRIALGHFTRDGGRVPLADADAWSVTKDGRVLVMEWKNCTAPVAGEPVDLAKAEGTAQVFPLKLLAKVQPVTVWLVYASYFGSNPTDRPPVVHQVTDMATGQPVLHQGKPVECFQDLRSAFWQWREHRPA